MSSLDKHARGTPANTSSKQTTKPMQSLPPTLFQTSSGITVGLRRKEYEWKMREQGKLVNSQPMQPEENVWESLLAGLMWAALIGLLVSLPYVAIRLGW